MSSDCERSMAEPPGSLWPNPAALGAVTDLYELTMMAGYAAAGIDQARATFELFVRRLPHGRAYLVFGGLEQAIGDLLRLAFSSDQVELIRRLPTFEVVDPAWFDRLADLRFEGDIWAVSEGSVIFAGEPLVRVVAPLAQAQWVETFLIASLSYPTLVASKAARIVEAAGGRPCYDFGARRGHGPQAGMLSARASYLAGFAGTSLVEAAIRLGIPAVGTMAHSWVQSFADEAQAFEAFASLYPGSTLLVDTYDSAEGVRHAAAMDPPIGAIRLDSGLLGAEAIQARSILDAAARPDVKIVASGDLDEYQIRDLLAAGAPIDGFGVGTELVTSRDAPALAMVYKLVELDGVGRIKLSPGKKTYPFAKQVFRLTDQAGRFACDVVAGADEFAVGEPLLAPVVLGGRIVGPLPGLAATRERCRSQVAMLPDTLRGPEAAATYPVVYSSALERESQRRGVR